MAEYAFNTPAGQTIDRKLLAAYMNTGTTAAPVWSILGKRVEDSSVEFDWEAETKKDIIGDTYGAMKTPTVTQTFDPYEADSGNATQQKLAQLAIVKQDARALANQDMLIVHFYLSPSGDTAKYFAERYQSCMVELTSDGGEGGGNLSMPINVTYGGTRTIGTVTKGADGAVSFAPEGDE